MADVTLKWLKLLISYDKSLINYYYILLLLRNIIVVAAIVITIK